MTASMQAVQIEEYGGPDVLNLRRLPIPTPIEGEVVVKVMAAGVGPWDGWIRAGKSVLPQPLPLTPGSDIAGVVVEVGPNVKELAVGDEIFGVTNRRFTDGYAQYARARVDMLAAKPSSMTFNEAASMPVIAVTAWQMLHEFASIKAGQRVLILGGAGNVGAYAVQLAHLAGAEVVATASDAQADHVRALGADEIIERSMRRVDLYSGSFDAVIDTVGGAALEQSYALVLPRGVVVSAVQKPDSTRLPQHVRSDFLLVDVGTRILESLVRLAADGELKVRLGDVLPLADARRAHQMLDGSKHQPGKILLIP
ncbi:NADP-dependent oxidoreductase [Paraburkholderia caledonica]|jgi:NADPH:quinone reductase-like Zn-dependent oxidoreductase|uniref:NADP-dependent oxidoreductase n=2 Tax=Paraburkholderia caledonica TaxID=134536 RepID=UPI000DEEB487|nr:NADP-dependent oxidoreductase [Paraburkholderia caledonica]AXF16822.1 quinone oxidoreductase [Paraburkholderia caledonica]